MDWINFDEIKKTVSLEMVLQQYGIKLKAVNATSRRGKCPLPMHGSEKSSNSFVTNTAKGVGGVWACQSRSCIAVRNGKKGGDTFEFVAAMEGCSLREAAEKMRKWFSVADATQIKRSPTYQRPEQTQPVSKESTKTEAEENKPLKFVLQNINHSHPYLASRRVTEEIARKFGVGYFGGRGMMHNRIVFEIHNERGELVAYAGRALDDTEPRYQFPPGFLKSLELYNLHRLIGESNGRRRVVIVEGFFPCLAVCALGFSSVALMGNSMSQAQEELIVGHFDVACILLDGNDVGQKGSADCIARLGRRMFVYAPVLPEGKQPDTLKPDELYAFIKN
jgi:DNA primase